jgi:cell division protein FtsQ
MSASGRSSGTTRRSRHRPGRRSPWLRGLLFWRSGNRRTGRASGSGTRNESSRGSGSARRITVEGSERPANRPRTAALLSVLLRVLGVLAATAALCAIGYGARWFLLHSRHFALRQVRVSPTRHIAESVLLRKAAVPAGHNLFSIDLEQVLKNLRAEPWLAKVSVRRELPAVLAIDVTEHEPAAVLALDALYLVDAEGGVFKRAAPGEYAGLPIVTGVGRTAYLMEPAWARKQVRAALQAVGRYRLNPDRPALGEAHVDRFAGVTLYTDQGVSLRVGRGTDSELDTRLQRFDVVWQALKKSGERPSVLFLDNRAHPDHVTVRLAGQASR